MGDPPSTTILLGKGLHALVDVADLPKIRGYNWRPRLDSGIWYVKAHIPGSGKHGAKILLHRLIMDAQPGQKVDHKSGDGLDNRRSNLRLCTNAENARNAAPHRYGKITSQLKGIYFDKQRGKYRVSIQHCGRKINLGRFADERTAALAYDAMARKLFGEFARCNFSLVKARE